MTDIQSAMDYLHIKSKVLTYVTKNYQDNNVKY